MSTLKMNITAKRITQLNLTGEQIFHTDDLANIWLIENKNTLRITLKRYSDAGLIFRIYKGLYSLLPLSRLDPILLGFKAIHGIAYLSTESVLFQEGVIAQRPAYYTFVSQKSLKFSIGPHNYISRKLSNKYLFNNLGVRKKDNYKIADLNRALADLLYFNKKYYFDRELNYKKINQLQNQLNYPLTKR